jgi:hypothetical protein
MKATSLYPIPPRHVLWGQTVALQPQGPIPGGGPPLVNQQVLLQTETYQEGVDWHVELSPASMPATGELVVTLTTSLGQAQWQQSFTLASTKVRTIHVFSRYVQLTAAWTGYTTGSATPIVVTAGCSVGGARDVPLSGNVQQYEGSNSNAGETAIAAGALPGGGFLSAYQASMTTMTGDAVAFVLFFDGPGPPAPGEKPIWRTPAFTAADQWFAFDDEQDPEVGFSSGLCWALSSTANVYTASSGSGVAAVDCKVGQ